MPKTKQGSELGEGLAKGLEKDLKFRSFKNDGKSFAQIRPNSEIIGVFLMVRDKEIRDRRTKQPKTIRVYSLRTDDGVIKIGSRALLDSVFDDIMDENGGYSVDEQGRYAGPGIEWIQNRVVKIIRGEDTETNEGDEMGTYELQVEQD